MEKDEMSRRAPRTHMYWGSLASDGKELRLGMSQRLRPLFWQAAGEQPQACRTAASRLRPKPLAASGLGASLHHVEVVAHEAALHILRQPVAAAGGEGKSARRRGHEVQHQHSRRCLLAGQPPAARTCAPPNSCSRAAATASSRMPTPLRTSSDTAGGQGRSQRAAVYLPAATCVPRCQFAFPAASTRGL